MDLGQLLTLYGTDKDAVGYTPVYHALLSQRRGEPLVIMEIGIGTMLPDAPSSMSRYALPGYRPGGSLRAWRDYFPRARVIGVDIQPDTQFTEDRISTELCDSTDPDQVRALFVRLNEIRPDIIVDDGSHAPANQLATLRNFYPHLRDGGFYFLEDIDPDSTLNNSPEALEPACGGDPFFFAGLKNNLCVFYKSRLFRHGPHTY